MFLEVLYGLLDEVIHFLLEMDWKHVINAIRAKNRNIDIENKKYYDGSSIPNTSDGPNIDIGN